MAGSRERGRRAAGDLERAVLAVLWAGDRALSGAEIRRALGDGLAYNTVQTTLTRLHRKGLVVRTMVGRAYRYRPAQTADEATAERMRELLAAGMDHRAVLHRFVSSLDESDGRTLRELLRETE